MQGFGEEEGCDRSFGFTRACRGAQEDVLAVEEFCDRLELELTRLMSGEGVEVVVEVHGSGCDRALWFWFLRSSYSSRITSF